MVFPAVLTGAERAMVKKTRKGRILTCLPSPLTVAGWRVFEQIYFREATLHSLTRAALISWSVGENRARTSAETGARWGYLQGGNGNTVPRVAAYNLCLGE